jgi:hypothetical protein
MRRECMGGTATRGSNYGEHCLQTDPALAKTARHRVVGAPVLKHERAVHLHFANTHIWY